MLDEPIFDRRLTRETFSLREFNKTHIRLLSNAEFPPGHPLEEGGCGSHPHTPSHLFARRSKEISEPVQGFRLEEHDHQWHPPEALSLVEETDLESPVIPLVTLTLILIEGFADLIQFPVDTLTTLVVFSLADIQLEFGTVDQIAYRCLYPLEPRPHLLGEVVYSLPFTSSSHVVHLAQDVAGPKMETGVEDGVGTVTGVRVEV